MTVTVTELQAGPFPATGVEQELPFEFKAFTDSEVAVLYGDSLAPLSPNFYTVDRNVSVVGAAEEGGSVTITAGVIDAGVDIYVVASPDFDQQQVYSSSGSRLENLNEGLDRSALRDLILQRAIDRVAQQLIDAVAEAGDAFGLVGKADKSANGADFADKQAVLQNLLFLASGANALARPVRDKLREVVSIHDFIGTGTAKLQAAIDSGAREILIPDTVVISGTVTGNGNFRLTGPGTIDLSGGGHLNFAPGNTAIPNLAADLVPFTTDIEFVAPHGLVHKDVFSVWNPTYFSYNPARWYYRAGDMFRVAEVISATKVRIYGVIQEAYDKDDVVCHKLNGGWLEFRDLTIIPPPTGVPLNIDGCKDIRLDGLKVRIGTDYTAINVNRSYNIGINDPEGVAHISDAYPIVIGSCQRVTVNATRGLYSRRHCFAMGGGSDDGSVPCADVRIYGMIGENIAANGIGSADIHGNCKRITYENCIFSLANIAGEDVTYRNCYITGEPVESGLTSGYCIYGTEAVGGLMSIENCHLVAKGTGSTGGNFLDIGVTFRTKPLFIRVRNCIFENLGTGSAGTIPVRIEVKSATPDPIGPAVSIDMDDITVMGDAYPALFLNIAGLESLQALGSVRLKNIRGISRVFGASLFDNYNIKFQGPGLDDGFVRVYGDVDVANTVKRGDHVAQVRFETDLTVERNFYLPDAGDCAPGDEVFVARPAGGAFNLNVRRDALLVALAAGQWCRVAYVGGPSIGSWKLMERGAY